MEFSESTEHRDLRKAIAAVTDTYGPAYYTERATAHEPTDELWRDLGRHGFIGIKHGRTGHRHIVSRWRSASRKNNTHCTLTTCVCRGPR
jgi:hypothetical protein